MPTNPKLKQPNLVWERIETSEIDHLVEKFVSETRLTSDKALEFITYWNDQPFVTNDAIAEKFHLSRPTVSKYRRLILQSIYFKREQRERIAKIKVATGDTTPTIDSDLTPEEMVAICDSRIRHLVANNGKDADIQKWMDFKVRFQGVTGAPVATTVDPYRLLGKNGLEAIQQEFIARLRILAKHHEYFPDLFATLRDLLNDLPAPLKLPPQKPEDYENPWIGVEHPDLPEPEPEPEYEFEPDSGYDDV